MTVRILNIQLKRFERLGCRFDCKVFGLEIQEVGDKLGAHGVVVGDIITAIQSQPVVNLEDAQEVVCTSISSWHWDAFVSARSFSQCWPR
jgi:hypothetical protein